MGLRKTTNDYATDYTDYTDYEPTDAASWASH